MFSVHLYRSDYIFCTVRHRAMGGNHRRTRDKRDSMDGGGDAKGIEMPVYTITTHTSNIRHAGTDARVTINLMGSDGSSGPLTLSGPGDLFENGKTDVFKFKLMDLGGSLLTKIDVFPNKSQALKFLDGQCR